jgi:hypothetical protein
MTSKEIGDYADYVEPWVIGESEVRTNRCPHIGWRLSQSKIMIAKLQETSIRVPLFFSIKFRQDTH